MKIVMLSVRDCCASGYRLCEAINENTEHTAKSYQWQTGDFNHPAGTIVGYNNVLDIQKEIDSADVIHVKGDRPWKVGYPNIKHFPFVKIDHKPVVLTLSGTLTRDVRFGGYGQCSRDSYPVKLVTAHEPDLMHDWVDILTYYPIRRAEATWKQSDPPILQHIPSNRITKDTNFVLDVVAKLKKNVIFELPGKMTYNRVLEMKKNATLYFDQFVIGWYGNSGVEAMNYGVPVISWISDFSRRFVDSPVITSEHGSKRWAEMIDWILDSDMTGLSRETKSYCDKHHSYEAVAKQWSKIYESLR